MCACSDFNQRLIKVQFDIHSVNFAQKIPLRGIWLAYATYQISMQKMRVHVLKKIKKIRKTYISLNLYFLLNLQ